MTSKQSSTANGGAVASFLSQVSNFVSGSNTSGDNDLMKDSDMRGDRSEEEHEESETTVVDVEKEGGSIFGPSYNKELDSFIHGDEIICNRVLYSLFDGNLTVIAYINKVVEDIMYQDEDRRIFLEHLGTDDVTKAVIEPVVKNYDVTSIGSNAFYESSDLVEIVIPDTVTEICDEAFAGCGSLRTIVFGESVDTIGENVFEGCDKLETIELKGDNIPECASSISSGCMLKVSEEMFETVVASDFGKLFTQITDGKKIRKGEWTYKVQIDKRKVEIVKYNGKSTDVLIPDSVIFGTSSYAVGGVGKRAFSKNNIIQRVKLSSHISYIADSAFEGCSALQTVDIPDSIMRIGKGAFKECESLSSVTLPNNLSTLEIATFKKCKMLGKIELPLMLSKIDDDVFSQCISLENIEFPSSVVSIGTRAFFSCKKFTNISLPLQLNHLGNGAFADCTGLEEVVFPEEFKRAHQSEMIDSLEGCDKINIAELLKN